MSTYNVEILNSFNLELELKDSEFAITNKLINLLCELRGLILVTTLVFKRKKKRKEKDDETKYTTFSSNSKAEILINESDIDDTFESIYAIVIYNHIKILWKRFWLNCWFSYRSH